MSIIQSMSMSEKSCENFFSNSSKSRIKTKLDKCQGDFHVNWLHTNYPFCLILNWIKPEMVVVQIVSWSRLNRLKTFLILREITDKEYIIHWHKFSNVRFCLGKKWHDMKFDSRFDSKQWFVFSVTELNR